MKKYYIAMALLIIFATAAATTLYFLNRGFANDDLRAADISRLQAAVQKYAVDNKKLPDNLKDLKLETSLPLIDYSYQKNSSSDFSICSTFKEDTRKISGDYSVSSNPIVHSIGYQCFKSTD